MEVSGPFDVPAALSTTKISRRPSNRSLCGPQNRYQRFGEETNFLSPPTIEPRLRKWRACSLSTI
jgi:hypothetical protein